MIVSVSAATPVSRLPRRLSRTYQVPGSTTLDSLSRAYTSKTKASTALRGIQINLRGLLSPSRRAISPSRLASPRDVPTRRGFALPT